MIDLKNTEINFTLQTVRQASQMVLQIQSEMVNASLTKDDRSPVTIADFASQALVAKLLCEAFPGDPLVAEEDATALRLSSEKHKLEAITGFIAEIIPKANPESVCTWIDRGSDEPARRFWTLDPIDGTKGFLRGDQYAIALALIVDGQVQVGALGCPKLNRGFQPDINGVGSLVIAARGQGSWVIPLSGPGSFERLRVSQCKEPSQARLLRSFESSHTNVEKIDRFVEALGIAGEMVCMDSQAKYAVLASGYGELVMRLLSPSKPDYREKIWDQASGALIIEEAGGQITDLHGKGLDFTAGKTLVKNQGVLASNGYLHMAAVQALSAVGA
jgi:3'(2'), 5'-bisphosphate nucleotidase